jgi:hypothetical protein
MVLPASGLERVGASLRSGVGKDGGWDVGGPTVCAAGRVAAFAGVAVLGSVVAVRDQLPGEPLG